MASSGSTLVEIDVPRRMLVEIGKALGSRTKDLALPVKRLLAAQKISTKGERRATRYFGV